jgi:DNA-binding response OmpR family regulator
MNYKVLLADDSLTIQKVIKITLANEPYDIVECNNDGELLDKIKATNPNLVFLDFTLSEKKSGYELSREIKAICPTAQVLIMYGTFDSIDEAEFVNSGASDKIVKPFDSTKFINICRNLVNEADQIISETPSEMQIAPVEEDFLEEIPKEDVEEDVEEELLEELLEEIPKEDIEEDDWVVNAPLADSLDHELSQDALVEVDEEPLTLLDETLEAKNSLESEIEDWGVDVPNIIGGGDDNADLLPPIIESESEMLEPEVTSDELLSLNQENIIVDDSVLVPESEELEYPDLSVGPQLTSLDDLNQNKDEDFEEEQSIDGTDTEEDVRNLEALIADETEDDLWAADEVSSGPVVEATSDEVEPVSASNSFEDVDIPDDLPAEDIPAPAKESLDDFDTPIYEEPQMDPPDNKEVEALGQIAAGSINLDEVVSEVLNKLGPKIEELVNNKIEAALNKQFTESTEKVAWDVIPELAENLIRDEIKKISANVLNN